MLCWVLGSEHVLNHDLIGSSLQTGDGKRLGGNVPIFQTRQYCSWVSVGKDAGTLTLI